MAVAEKVDISRLIGPQATLLMPLWSRAVEGRRANPILRDAKAEEIVDRLDFPFERFRQQGVDATGFCTRAHLTDGLVRDFMAAHDDAVVVEIGAGLDTRFDRLDDGRVTWFDLDLPGSMAIRKQFIDENPRRTFITASALDDSWHSTIQSLGKRPIFFVAEGVFYFFTHAQVAALLKSWADAFPGAHVAFDGQSPLFLWYNNLKHPLKTSRMSWSFANARTIESIDPRIQLERYVGFGDFPEYKAAWARAPWLQRAARTIFPPIRHFFKVAQFRLGR